MSVKFPCSGFRSSEGSKLKNIGTDVIFAHEQCVVPKRHLYRKMTSHNKKKIKKKMTKDSSSFSCIFEDNCMNISFRNCLPQKLIFLTETKKVLGTYCQWANSPYRVTFSVRWRSLSMIVYKHTH